MKKSQLFKQTLLSQRTKQLIHNLCFISIILFSFAARSQEVDIQVSDSKNELIEELWMKVDSQKLGIPKEAFKRAYSFVLSNKQQVRNQDYLTLINFDLPSTKKRMFIINLNSGAVEKHLVAHGVNSGGNIAEKFSNTPGSKRSSLGIYLTLKDYHGEHGRALKLRGLESSNNMAEKRDIVMHSADYVSSNFAEDNERLGRSWGCPAIEKRERTQILNKIQDGSVLYIFKSAKCSRSCVAN